MYYRGVNRGLYATAPGKYTTALVMALGLFAIASGYNAIYLSLSLGMAIIVISGIQSERVIRAHEILSFRELTTDAEENFHFEFHVVNLSEKYPVYGVDSFIAQSGDFPRAMNDGVQTKARARTLALAPGESRWVLARAQGFARGSYSELKVVQKTIFPFGLIAKFKYATVPGKLTVLPKFDWEFAERFRKEFATSFSQNQEPAGFHHHRVYTGREPLSFIDWKKSAGKEASDWVVKTFEGQSRRGTLWILPRWETRFATVEDYEHFLSRVRTVLEVVVQVGGEWKFRGADGSEWEDAALVRQYLANLPRWSEFVAHTPKASVVGDSVVVGLDDRSTGVGR